MKKRFVCLLLLCAALLLCLGAALAEENPVTVSGRLISEGAFPEARKYYARSSTDGLEDFLVSRLSAGTKEISVLKYGLSPEVFADFYWDMLNHHPELFFVAGQFSYYTEDGKVKSILPEYIFSGSELTQRKAEFEDYVSSIVRYASVASSDIGRMLRVNDYFCVNFEYDMNYSVYRPDQLFRDKTGVCQAYMLAYAAVLNELGIENTYATSESMNHIWNVVRLDGEWYHIDVTWNDPVTDIPLRARHYYFLLSDDALLEADHYSWESSVTAVSDAYDDFFWRGLDTPLPVLGSEIYYYSCGDDNGERSIYKWNEASHKTALIHTFPVTSYYYPGFMALAADSNFLYYGEGDTLYSIGHEGGNPAIIHVLEDDSAKIWSAWREGSRIRMLTGADLSGPVVTAEIPNPTDAMAILPAFTELEIGKTKQLYLVAADDPENVLDGAWTSSDINIASVSKKGLVSGKSMGVVKIAALNSNLFAEATVVVHSKERISLPPAIKEIRAEAFADVAAEEIVIPKGVESIGEHAFRNCTALKMITIPSTVVSIAENAFEGCSADLLILAAEGSAAHDFAAAEGIAVELIG